MMRLPNLLPKNLRRARKILISRGTRREDAEDLIQEAYIKMQQYCAKGGEVREPEGFLVRAGQRLAVNARRDAHHELYANERVEELTSLIDANPTPEEELAAHECLLRMKAALDAINPRSRDVFFMHRFEGLKHPEIARRLSISVSAVEKHVAIGLAALAEASVQE